MMDISELADARAKQAKKRRVTGTEEDGPIFLSLGLNPREKAKEKERERERERTKLISELRMRGDRGLYRPREREAVEIGGFELFWRWGDH